MMGDVVEKEKKIDDYAVYSLAHRPRASSSALEEK